VYALMKQCKKCLQSKRETDFYTTTYKNKIYLLNECKTCSLVRTRKNYLADHEVQKEIRKLNTNKRRTDHKQKLLDYLLAHPCIDCDEKDPIVLEFDHIRGVKSFNISAGLMKNWEVMQEEINKCEIVCANCHKRRTAKRAGDWYKDVKVNMDNQE
jgi:hypothetical protein